MNPLNYIELNRSFNHLSTDFSQSTNSEDSDFSDYLQLNTGDTFGWDELLKLHRVILISEAGSGKTEEIRQTSIKLRAEGKQAFFIRLESLSDEVEDAFEEGSYQEFQSWLSSTDEGWVLLDSIDEARLKSPKDFELAIRKIARYLLPAMQRVHIIITGRVNAWRPISDLLFCDKKFPYASPETIEKELDPNNETLDNEDKQLETTKETVTTIFNVYSLADLSAEQIKTFLKGKGISDTTKILDDIERHDAWSYTTRPQDLEEIIAFWNKNNKIGTRLELMQHSIERRLKERDQDRAELAPITTEKLREGATLLAAAATLMHESTINIPDGSNDSNGIHAKNILKSWDDKECQILLARPIFDEALYGTVRFHHRSVREFLTAEWLFELLKEKASRRNIENFFSASNMECR